MTVLRLTPLAQDSIQATELNGIVKITIFRVRAYSRP